MKYDIITIGSATVDYFADSDSELISLDTRTSHESLIAFPLGGKILITELNTTTGGGGTNTAVSFSRLGFKTAWLGKLGNDVAADFVRGKLKQENVDFIGKSEGNTGVSFILNSIRDDRTILTYKGANNNLLPEDMPPIQAPWVYLSSMLEKSLASVIGLVKSDDSFKLAFNPSSYQASMGYEKLKPLIDRVSILIMNREEACKFLGRDPHQHGDMQELVTAMVMVPDQIAVITDGASGVWVCDGKTVYWGHPLEHIEILETTGAGDAFASTFTACKIREIDTAQAIDFAMTNAESVLQHKGAKEKLLDWQALSNTVKSSTRKIETFALPGN